VQNHTLDALYSHFLADSKFVLQQDLDDNPTKVRWTCHTDGITVETLGNTISTGSYSSGGTDLYQNGYRILFTDDAPSHFHTGDFMLGCIVLDSGGFTQYAKLTVERIMITKRKLTDEEQVKLHFNAIGGCPKPDGQLLYNWDFRCGRAGWAYRKAYDTEITANSDWSIHFKAKSIYSSLVPVHDEIFPADTYIYEFEAKNVSGNGRVVIQDSTDQWHTLLTYTTDGYYKVEYTGDIKQLVTGANNDDTFEADYYFVSLRRANDPVVSYRGDTVTYQDETVTYNP
jgi:hypothetical protein